MKKLLTLLLIFLCALAYGQAPNLINYQGIARNSVGNVLPNKNISVRLTIRGGSATGTMEYSETRKISTNSFGLFTIAIGSTGAVTSVGDIATINWASGSKFLQVEIDPAGGGSFVNMGAAQLLSVPYALYAGSSVIAGPAGGALTGTYPNPSIADGVITQSMLSAGITAIPNGSAGGDLTGVYPNPTIKAGAVTTTSLANNSVSTFKIIDGSVTAAKLAAGVIPTSLPPNGAAGGDLAGTYPNPTIKAGAVVTNSLATNSVSTIKLIDGSVTLSKIAAGVIPTSLPPSGAAGGDLVGSYPNPTIKTGAVITSTLADNSVSTFKLIDGSVTLSKIAAGVIPTSLPPNGTAGGDLGGSYPNPSVSKISGVALSAVVPSNGQVLKFNGTQWAPAADNIGGGGPPSGPAGGDLSGTYPDPNLASGSVTVSKIANGAVNTPKIADGAVNTNKLADNSISTIKIIDGAVTAAKLAPGLIPTSLPPSGAAGGDLAGTYPNPTIKTGAVITTSLADNSVSTFKLIDGSVTAAKIAAGVIPTTLPPSGAAGGDLGGSYPNPSVSKISGVALSAVVPSNGQVLKFNGTQWAPAADNIGGGGLTLPFAATDNNSLSLFALTNQGAGASLEGNNSTTNANAFGVLGQITNTNPGVSASAIRGINSGINVEGIGVWGSHNGYGKGVYGTSIAGSGINGYSSDGLGVFGTSDNGTAGYFDISNPSSYSDALFSYNVGTGAAATAISENGVGIWGITYSAFAAGIIAYNIGGGEALVGRNISNTAGAIVGRNDGTFAGVQGIGAADGATGILASSNVDGFINGNALVASLDGPGTGNPAVFMANGANVARIDETGKGYFNNGTQLGGADVAEFFDVEGKRNDYEPGDVLIISRTSDRKVEKSSTPYSTLVAGVYATKPGVLLTDRNAEKNQLDEMVPMGVVGVVPTKVCMEGGAIKRGDLIVTSSVPGVAMKADPNKVKVGQVIGKALQDYSGSGQGKINILVSIK